MGIEGISPFRLLIILAIVLVLFGGRRLRDLGGDLGSAIRGFKDAMKDGEQQPQARLTDAAPGSGKAASVSGCEHQDG